MIFLGVVIDDEYYKSYDDSSMRESLRLAIQTFIQKFRIRGVEVILIPASIADWECFQGIPRI